MLKNSDSFSSNVNASRNKQKYRLASHRLVFDFSHSSLKAHLVGIAGNGMRALAAVLAARGWTLSGSDCSDGVLHSFGDQKIKIFQGHAAQNVPPDADFVVASDAVPSDNVELQRAAELGIPRLSYFEMLGRLSQEARTIAIAGTHGKSTTTAMLGHILTAAGRDPTVLCGATPLGAPSGGRRGRDDFMVVEACEYRAHFLHLHPRQAAILNIEPDHFDCFPSQAELETAFRRFASLLPTDGFLLVRHDCETSRRIAADAKCRVTTFGFSPDAAWSAQKLRQTLGRYQAELQHDGRRLCEVQLKTPGKHNVLNAVAAAALAFENGVSAEQIAEGLSDFRGLHRRLEVLGTWRGATVIDDYAHHPTALAAALAAVREMFPEARIWCVFQPHQASRTARLLDALAASLRGADKVLVADIFRAREGPWRPGEATAADLARRAVEWGVEVCPGRKPGEIVEFLHTQLAPGDVLVTLGAGDVERLWGKVRFQ
jgi:UDP-N-acetylmuramate--alanine ligase